MESKDVDGDSRISERHQRAGDGVSPESEVYRKITPESQTETLWGVGPDGIPPLPETISLAPRGRGMYVEIGGIAKQPFVLWRSQGCIIILVYKSSGQQQRRLQACLQGCVDIGRDNRYEQKSYAKRSDLRMAAGLRECGAWSNPWDLYR